MAVVLGATLLIDLNRLDLPENSVFRDADPLGYVLVALLVLPLALRRRYPVAVFATILAAACVVGVLFYRPSSFGFGLIIATYTVARWCKRPISLATADSRAARSMDGSAVASACR